MQDTSELVAGVGSDVLVGAALGGEAELPSLDQLTKLVRTVLNNPGIDVVAASGEEPSDERLADMVRRATDEIHRRLAASGSTTYDELLTDVRDAVVADPGLARRLAERFPVALIDEFQDTDPVQWEIFSSVFGRPPSTLVIVGDPKQAIYSFRGGDVHTYLRAADDPDGDRPARSGTNWRSDRAVVQAMNGLCDGLVLGDAGIVFHAVDHDPSHAGRAVVGADGLELAPIVGPPGRPVRTSPGSRAGSVMVGSARELIELDLAAQVADLLDRRPDRRRPRGPGSAAARRRRGGAHPGPQRGAPDPAGLGPARHRVGHHRWAQRHRVGRGRPVAGAARRAEPAVRSRSGAGGRPHLVLGVGSARAGRGVRRRRWPRSSSGTTSGPPSCGSKASPRSVSRIRHESPLVSLVLARPDGERDLTDLEHLAELLHQTSDGRPVGAAQLVELLAELDRDQAEDDDPEAIKRRVDSDDAAVQIMTVHAAKGLEFGVVCCPSLWNPGRLKVTTKLFHDPDSGRRVLDVSQAKSKAVTRNHACTQADQIGEHARLAYVALTRAKHRTLVWWAAASGSAKTGVARVLFGLDPDAVDPAAPAAVLADADCQAGLDRRFVERGAGPSTWPSSRASPPRRPARRCPVDGSDAADRARSLTVAQLGRVLDRSAGRWSFTAMARFATSDPDDETLGDHGSGDELSAEPGGDPDGESPTPSSGEPGRPTTLVPLGEVGAGPAFGTLVHAVLEDVDFAAADLDSRDRRRHRAAGLAERRHPRRRRAHRRSACHARHPAGPGLRRPQPHRVDPRRSPRRARLRAAPRPPASIDGWRPAPSAAWSEARLDPSDPIRPWAARAGDGPDRPRHRRLPHRLDRPGAARAGAGRIATLHAWSTTRPTG